MALKRADLKENSCLTAETIQSTALAFQRVNHVHGSDCFPLCVLGVRDSVTNYILQENFENTTSLFVDEARNTFHTATASQTTNSWFCDTLDIITQNFPMTLRATFSQTLSSLASASHDDRLQYKVEPIMR